MRTTITIDDALLTEVKQIAAQTNRTVSSVLEDAVRESIARREGVRSARLEIPVSGDPGTKPLVDILDRDALAVALEDDRL